MSKLYYRADPKKIPSSAVFTEASKEELRVLLSVLATETSVTEEELAKLSACSLSRCKAALTLFISEGLIETRETPFEESVIEYEYKGPSHFSDIETDSPLEVAKTIKKESLADLLDECAAILGKAALNSTETANIVSLATNLSLSGEYITTLLSFLGAKRKCTVQRLVKKAEELVSQGVDSYEELEEYIRDRELPSYVWEYRRVFGIYGRSISQTERELYKKWAEEFDYSTEIVALAYDKAVLAGSPDSIQYIDAVISAWHAAGCKTVAECEENSKAFKDSKSAAKAEKSRQKTKAPTPRYGDFDVEEAFRLALERSYGEENKQ